MNRILIAYYSWGGKTETVAKTLHAKTGGDLFRIESVKPYPSGYSETTRVAKQELRENARPELTEFVADIDRYDTLFLGYPNWWGTIPMVVSSFLEAHDLKGKIICPFCTHGGGGIGRSEADIQKLCPGAQVLKGLSLSGHQTDAASGDVDSWLRSLNL